MTIAPGTGSHLILVFMGRGSCGMGTDRIDFFISHAAGDRAWAEWVAWQLTDAGYMVELAAWDWAAGQNFVTAMSDALDRCDRVVALFSAAYFDRPRYTTEEWSAALVHSPGIAARLVPLRVEDVPAVKVPAMLQPLLSRDLFDMDAVEARRVLLEAVHGPQRPSVEPVFPGRGPPGGLRRLGGSGPRRPGSLPRVWNLPARNRAFTGRGELLVAVRERLLAGDTAVVQALQGMGGVGKTQLAAEYAYRFAGAYDLAWWVNAERAGLIGAQFAALGTALGCLQPGADAEAVKATVLGELRERERWLLVFDNAQSPDDVTGWLPGGGGHVLITSRERNWAEIAASVEVDVLARAESVAILHGQVTGLTEVDADRLAYQLGDLPLAVAQAAGFMAKTGMPATVYLELLRTRAADILDRGTPVSYPVSLAAATQLIADRLDREDPAAGQLASLCAFLAPEPIPLSWFTKAAGALPELTAGCAADPLAWAQLPSRVCRNSLGQIDRRKASLQMHRLTQAILCARLTPGQAAAARARAREVLAANNPGTADEFDTWSDWALLVPHVLAVDSAAFVHSAHLRDLACGASWYLLKRGDTDSGYALSGRLHARWPDQLGPDHPDTLRASTRLAVALRMLGHYQEASDLNKDTSARRRRLYGDDHPHTLISAGNLAGDLRGLGQVDAAFELNQDNLTRRRRLYGDDDPRTFISATCVARDLAASGRIQEARELNEDTLARRRRVLGDDHPGTFLSALSLVANLRDLGEDQAAEDLYRDTLARQPRVAKGIDLNRIQEHEPEDVRLS
jgi:hypothetical protein